MKQLEPILKYHFWILLFVALIMAFTGWWMTTGQMKAAITDRRNKIEEAKKKIPDPKDHPSKDWEEKLTAINAEQDKLIRSSRAWLYDRQKERMVWPKWIPEAAQLKYREPFKDSRRNIIYRDNYMKEVIRLYEIPRPIGETQESTEGVVNFPFSVMPHREWGDTPPSNEQMWDSMEDLWLLEPLLQAVLETNGGVNATRHDASVVAIEYIKLHGGDRSKIGQSTDAAATTGPGMGAGMPGMMMGAGEGKMERGGGVAAASSGPGSTSTDIKQIEEFGDPGSDDPNASGAGASAGPGAMPAMPGMGVGASEDFRPGLTGGMGGAGNEDVGRRYIDNEDGAPYRTRGFKLTVVMDHRKVPDLYAQLTSSERSPWPVKILRMNIADFKEADSFGGGGGGGMPGMPGMAGGGRPFTANGGGPGAFPGGAGGRFPAGGGLPKPGGLPGGMGNAGGRGKFRGDREDGFPSNLTGGAIDDPMEKPGLARVTFVGLITLYNEPPQAESTSAPGAAPAETAAGQPAAGDSPTSAESSAADDEAMDGPGDSATSDADDDSEAGPKPDSDLEDPDRKSEGEMEADDKGLDDETMSDDDVPEDQKSEDKESEEKANDDKPSSDKDDDKETAGDEK